MKCQGAQERLLAEMKAFIWGSKEERMNRPRRVWFIGHTRKTGCASKENRVIKVVFKRKVFWFVLKEGNKRCVGVVHLGKTKRRFSVRFTWQGSHHGVQILRDSFRQEGDTCARHAGVRSVEYRMRDAVARYSSGGYFPVKPLYGKKTAPSDAVDLKEKQYPFEYATVVMDPPRVKNLRFPNLSIQQVIDNAGKSQPNFQPLGPLNMPPVFGYLRDSGVTLEQYYPMGAGNANPDWKRQNRLFIQEFELLWVGQERVDFYKDVIKHYTEGPIVGEVFLSRNFKKDFLSKKGYSFSTRKMKCQDVRKLLISDVKDPDKNSPLVMPAHYFVIIAHGFATWMGFRLKCFQRRRLFFLCQDSSGVDNGPFKNSIVIVFARALTDARVPHLFPPTMFRLFK